MSLIKNFTDEQNEKSRSLSYRLQRMMLGTVLFVIVAFLVAVFFITSRERREYGFRESENVLKSLSSNISSSILNYSEISRLVMTQEQLVKFLRADFADVDISMINDARYAVMDILNVTEGVDTVIVIREDMLMLGTNRFTYRYDQELLHKDDWKRDIYAGKGKAVISLNSNGVAIKSPNRPMVTIGRAIYDIDSQERTGILLMNISANIFDKMLGQLRYNDIVILGDDGTFLAGNRNYAEYFDSSFATSNITHRDVMLEAGRGMVSGCRVGDMPIVILKVSPLGHEGTPVRILGVLALLLCTFIIAATLTSNFIRKNITDPFFKLSDAIVENRKSGELKKVDVPMPNSELAMLEGDYNNMIDHVNELIVTLMEKEKTLQSSQMRVLQEQIKPHFLYNSIETIGYMALDAGADKVHDALETMGSFYRNFLSKGGRDIPFSREVRIVKDYLSLQKLRYGDIIQDEYDIDENTENFIVPKLILQPLVENSIYHGIRLKGEPGVISISARLEENNSKDAYSRELHVVVRDTGVGMEQEKIDKILSMDKKDRPKEADESFGLWGTIERIRMYTGYWDCVRIESEIGEYTVIEIVIPDMPGDEVAS